MATNDFLPFANGGGANVLTQAQYAALTALLSGGYQSGVANSAQMNKTWRQSSIMAAVLGQFAADYSGNNSVDDGTIATLEANLVAAIRSATKTGVILADTGATNAYTAVNSPPLVAGTWVDGVVQQVKIAHANTGASTYAPDGLAAIPIYGLGLQPLQGGELALNGTAVLMRLTIAGVNSGNPIAVLMECAGGAQQVAPATQSQHALQLGQATGRLLNIQTFTVSGTYTPTAGTKNCRVTVVGGGSSGGGAAVTTSGQWAAGGGGGGGANAIGYYPVATLTGQTVTVGAGGAAASGNGNNGGTSSIGAVVTAGGGVGGAAGFAATTPVVAAGGSGGASIVGANVSGGLGGPGGGGIAMNTGNIFSGSGGGSYLSQGSVGILSSNSAGNAGSGPGCGGSGATSSNGGVARASGAGSAGSVIIEEFA